MRYFPNGFDMDGNELKLVLKKSAAPMPKPEGRVIFQNGIEKRVSDLETREIMQLAIFYKEIALRVKSAKEDETLLKKWELGILPEYVVADDFHHMMNRGWMTYCIPVIYDFQVELLRRDIDMGQGFWK